MSNHHRDEVPTEDSAPAKQMPILHGGNIREAIQKYRLKNKRITDFSANINPLGLPQRLKKIIMDNLAIIQNYPDPDCAIIKKQLSHYLNIPAYNLLIGNGSVELIFLLTFVLKPKKVLIPIPAFSEYEKASGLSGGRCLFLKTSEEKGFEIKIEEILKNLNGVDLIFICNPNNPTGFLWDREAMQFLVRRCKDKDIFLVIDEVFIDFVKEKEEISLVKSVRKNKHILVLQSLTKFFALPGLRLGYLVGEKKLVKKISAYQPPWSVNSLAQLSGAEILRDRAFIQKSREYIFRERERFFGRLQNLRFLKPYPPTANFIFCKLINDAPPDRLPKAAVGHLRCPVSGGVNKGIDCGQLADYCGRRGLLIRDCSNFRGLNRSFVRIAVRKKEENKKLIKTLKEFQRDYVYCIG